MLFLLQVEVNMCTIQLYRFSKPYTHLPETNVALHCVAGREGLHAPEEGRGRLWHVPCGVCPIPSAE